MTMKVHFEKAVKNLEELLSENAARVDTAVKTALKAVRTGDAESAETVLEGDSAIDLAENAIEEECLEILALYQPVAADLRRIATILKANGEIERAGDLATSIAGRVKTMAASNPKFRWDFSGIAEIASDMFSRALDSLLRSDDGEAREVIKDDDTVDSLHSQNYAKAGEAIAKDPEASGYYMSALTVSRSLERLADLATNIAEDVIYLKTAEIVRHIHPGPHHILPQSAEEMV